MTATLMLRGQEFELDTIAVDVMVNTAFFAVTVSAMVDDGGGDTNRVFAHTHFEDVIEGNLPTSFEPIVADAIAAFKEAMTEQGGWIIETGEGS